MNNGMILTEQGRNLLSKALTGKTLHFTRAFVGDGELGGRNAYSLTALVSPRKELPIQSVNDNGTGVCEVVLEMSNAGMSKGFFVREYGLFAEDPDTGKEILYSYANKGSECGYLEAQSGGSIIAYVLSLITVIDQAPNITATINSNNSYVTATRLESRVQGLYADATPEPSGFWTYAPGQDTRLRPLPLEATRRAILGTHDAQALASRIEAIENNIAEILLAQEVNNIFPGCTSYIIEDFKNINQVDMYTCRVTGVVAGDNSLDCSPIAGMLPGSWYTLTDGINSENVQAESISTENGIQRVMLSEPVKNTYQLADCRIYRSDVNISDSARAPGVSSSLYWTPNYTWKGQGAASEFTADLNTSAGNMTALKLTGYSIINSDNMLTLTFNPQQPHDQSTGLLVSESYAVDCVNADSVGGVNIRGTMLENVYYLFNIGGHWVKLGQDGVAVHVTDNEPTYDVVRNSGNTSQELISLSSIPAFCEKRFAVAIGLYSDDPANNVPSVHFSVNCFTSKQLLIDTKYSPVYTLNNAKLISLASSSTRNGQGSVSLTAQVTYPDGSKSAWLLPDQLPGVRVNAVQFRANYSVQVLGNSITLTDAKLIYSRDSITAGASTGTLVSITQNWYMKIRQGRVNVKHKQLDGKSEIHAYMSLRMPPVQVKREQLGIGGGYRKTYQLAHRDGLRYDSVKLYYDSAEVNNFDVNCEVGRLTCTPPEGVIVSCSYEYGWGKETWQEMPLDKRYELDDYEVSEYKGEMYDNNLSVAAIKLVMTLADGHIDGETLGTASGNAQTFMLKNIIRDGNISVYEDGALLNPEKWRIHDDPEYITVTAKPGSVITVNYDWISTSPDVYQFAAIFTE